MKAAWLVTLVTLAACARAGAQDTPQARILALEVAWNQAVQERDGKAVEPLLGNELIYIDHDGTVMDKGHYMASVKSPALHAEQITNESMKVPLHGKPYLHRELLWIHGCTAVERGCAWPASRR
jgi:hypothetical protein